MTLWRAGPGTLRLQIPSIVETFEMIRCSEEASFVNGKVTTRIIDWRMSHFVHCLAPDGASNTRCNEHRKHRFLGENERQFVNGPKPCLQRTLPSAFCCMCEPMETAQSPGDDTHAAVNIGQEGVGARTTRRVGSFVSMGCRPGPSIGAQTSTRAKASVRPQARR